MVLYGLTFDLSVPHNLEISNMVTPIQVPMTAAELSKRLIAGEHTFSNIHVIDDIEWDAAGGRGDLTIDGNLTLSGSTFGGRFSLGDLNITGELYVAGSVFTQRASLYRIKAAGLYAQGTTFHKGLGVLNSELDIALFMKAKFPGDSLQSPAGLLIKKTSGRLLDLSEIESAQTVLELTKFETVTTHNATLGRRTPTQLREIA